MQSIREKILKFGKTNPLFRAEDIPFIGNDRTVLSRMVQSGDLVRLSPGLFCVKDIDISENYTLAEAIKTYRGGVICLISALYFHGVGSQLPYETWLMRQDRNTPRNDAVPVRFIYSSGNAYSFGIETHMIHGVEVPIYSVAKTVADCFKYRNKIGLDVAIEALKDAWLDKKITMEELWPAVKVCKVQKVIQPYVEMLVK